MAKTGSKHIKSYIMLSDRELIALAKKGEQPAFTILFERYHNGLMSHIQDILIGGNDREKPREMSEEPQDVCQETFNKAFGKIHVYNTKYEFTTWLYNIAKNTAIDYIRRRKKDLESSVSADTEEQGIGNILSAPKDTPEENMIGSQETQRVLAVIEKLPKIYRDVLYMSAVQEFAYEEIAKELSIPMSSVKVRLNRAKNMLANELTDSPLAQKRNRKNKKAKERKNAGNSTRKN